MRLSEMNKQQIAEESLFVSALSKAGWDADGIANMLRVGIAVHPEGHATLDTPKMVLAAQFFAAEQVITLLISTKEMDNTVRLRFEYGDNLESLLNWLVKSQEQLKVEAFAKQLREAIKHCKKVFFIDDTGTMYRLGLEG